MGQTPPPPPPPPRPPAFLKIATLLSPVTLKRGQGYQNTIWTCKAKYNTANHQAELWEQNFEYFHLNRFTHKANVLLFVQVDKASNLQVWTWCDKLVQKQQHDFQRQISKATVAPMSLKLVRQHKTQLKWWSSRCIVWKDFALNCLRKQANVNVFAMNALEVEYPFCRPAELVNMNKKRKRKKAKKKRKQY